MFGDKIILKEGIVYQQYGLSCGCTGDYLFWTETQDCIGCQYQVEYQCQLTACCKTKSYIYKNGNVIEFGLNNDI